MLFGVKGGAGGGAAGADEERGGGEDHGQPEARRFRHQDGRPAEGTINASHLEEARLYSKLQRFLNLRYWSMGGGT